MKRLLKTLLGTFLFLGFVAGAFLWFEAEKEVRILCSTFHSGQSLDKVAKTLNTGAFLEYRSTKIQGNETIITDTPYTFGTSRCLIHLATDKSVISSQYKQSFKLNKVAAWGGVVMLAGLAIFQLLLAAGFPFGNLAWGGWYETKLPIGLRFASALVVFILVFGIIVLLEKAQVIHVLSKPQLVDYSVWIFGALFGLSTIANLNSKSESERKMGTPIALLLCFMHIVVGMAG